MAENKTRHLERTSSALAQVRYLRMTPMKCRRVIDLVRGMDVQRGAGPAALPAAGRQRADRQGDRQRRRQRASTTSSSTASRLYISQAYVDEGPTLKRFRPRAQGRAYRIRKRTSHITVVVSTRPAAPAASHVATPTKKAGAR